MRSRNVTSMGALHPVLFFAVMYVVVLFFSIFICSTLFYSCTSNPADTAQKKETPAKHYQSHASPAVVAR